MKCLVMVFRELGFPIIVRSVSIPDHKLIILVIFIEKRKCFKPNGLNELKMKFVVKITIVFEFQDQEHLLCKGCFYSTKRNWIRCIDNVLCNKLVNCVIDWGQTIQILSQICIQCIKPLKNFYVLVGWEMQYIWKSIIYCNVYVVGSHLS